MLKSVINNVLSKNRGKCLDEPSEFDSLEHDLDEAVRELIETEFDHLKSSSDISSVDVLSKAKSNLLGCSFSQELKVEVL